ncbi:MAG: hypothetical protein MUP80_17030 [Acidobacteriia bacterium]|nr:hypothetical protein [Terriglobia bacterium]
MGGRRGRSLAEIVGTGLSRQKEQFEEAIASRDPYEVAVSSARLLARSKRAVNILYYASKLSDFIREVVESGKDLTYAERQGLARSEWSRIKKKEDIKDDPIVTQAVIRATAKAIAKSEK